MNPQVIHPHRRDRGRSYYGATWAAANRAARELAKMRKWNEEARKGK